MANRLAPINVLIVDDHFVVRMGLVASIGSEPDMVVVGEAASGEEAIDKFRRLQPDIALMDLRLPRMDGAEATAAIRREFSWARIIVLTVSEAGEDLQRSMQAGACAYLLKTVEREDLLRTIRAVHAGQSVLAPTLAGQSLSGCREQGGGQN